MALARPGVARVPGGRATPADRNPPVVVITREDLTGHIDDPVCCCFRCRPEWHTGVRCNCAYCRDSFRS